MLALGCWNLRKLGLNLRIWGIPNSSAGSQSSSLQQQLKTQHLETGVIQKLPPFFISLIPEHKSQPDWGVDQISNYLYFFPWLRVHLWWKELCVFYLQCHAWLWDCPNPVINSCFVLLTAFSCLFSGSFMTFSSFFFCAIWIRQPIYMYSFNNKYNVYKNKTSIPDRIMCLHTDGTARGSQLFPGIKPAAPGGRQE